MVNQNIVEAAIKYESLNDIIELAAHHDEGTPIRRICEYLANLTADIIDTIPENENVSDE